MTENKSLRFYDTSSALLLQEKIFDDYFYISYCTLLELENIKTSARKDQDIKAKARNLTRLLRNNKGNYKVVHYGRRDVKRRKLEFSNDNIIVAGAYRLSRKSRSTQVLFYTDDIACENIASELFGLCTKSAKDELVVDDYYTGYKEVVMTELELDLVYQNLDNNFCNCLINEYLVVRNRDGGCMDILRWTSQGFMGVYTKPLYSKMLGGKIYAKDIYQRAVIDSIINNPITAISGGAGSGKSLLALAAALKFVENGRYSRLVILFNPTQTRGAQEMGYYGGDMIEKALQSNIGNILTSKLGDRYAVDMLIEQGKLKLVPMSDCRGFEVRPDEVLWISECQNTSVDLLKLCLSRVSEGSKTIIEGDYLSQVDSYAFENTKNGMKRAINVLKGEDIFGYVQLQNVYRSKIANLINKM